MVFCLILLILFVGLPQGSVLEAHEVLFVFATPLCHLKETQYWLSYLCGRHTTLYLV